MKITKTSSWDESQIQTFLSDSTTPIRLAVTPGSDKEDFPLICSIWFEFKDGCFYCATHENSLLAKTLLKNNRCAFDISVNQPPYKGVRGQGTVELSRENTGAILEALLVRYLGDTKSSLAKWLLGRVDEEYVIKITPKQLSSWDYSERMS